MKHHCGGTYCIIYGPGMCICDCSGCKPRKQPACATATLIEPPQKVFYLATIFDPQLKKERIVSVTSGGMCKSSREINLGIDRVDRWGRVTACCAAHAREEFSKGSAIWYS